MPRKSSVLTMLSVSLALSVIATTYARAGTLCVSGYCGEELIPPASGIGPIESPLIPVQPTSLELVPFQDDSGWHYFFSMAGPELVSYAIPLLSG